jgi:putative transposase
MPRGLVRYQQTGDFHFLTFSCYRRLAYLNTAAARELFESALERIRQRYRFVVAGYVVMPEHVHLLVSEPRRGTLARVVQALKLSVSLRRPERPFWQARYYDFNVHGEEKRVEKLRYMHRNPVVRGLCAKPEEWKWSSFRHYATGFEGTVEIESSWTASRRGWQLPAGWELERTQGDVLALQVPKCEGPGAPIHQWDGHTENRATCPR